MEVSSSAFIHSNGHALLSSSNAHQDNREPETGSILDPFHIEDLLDFSNEDIAGPIGDEGMQQPSSNNNSSSVTASGETQGGATSILRSGDIEQHANEFSIDCDDMPELEWLSSLVEDDSFCMGNEAHKNVFIGGCCSPMSSSVNNNKRHLLLEESSKDRFQVGSPISVLESNSATSGSRMVNVVKDLAVVPGRPRSKRQRTGVSTWTNSSCVLNNNNNNMFMSFSSPATSSVSDYDTTYNIVSDEQLDSGLSLDNSSEQDVVDSGPSLSAAVSASAVSAFENKKQFFSSNVFPARAGVAAVKGKPPLLKGGAGNQEVQPRRCTHCLSQKTPQWRAGPEGPKTLCNACGVRFKSGRLFPEYRPALSPTFHSEVHSNSHRKVLEMRRQKEVVAKPLPTAQEQQQQQQQQGEVLDGGLIYK